MTDKNTLLFTVFFLSSIVCSPEIEHIELTSEDMFLVVACDGLWDVIDAELATRIVLQQIEKYGRGSEGAQRAAEELQELAYRLASSDNITVLVIMFTPLEVMR
jgi:serine/threonine protein phosphatase PrpC